MRPRSLLPAVLLVLLATPVARAAKNAQAAFTWTVDAGTTGVLVEDHRVPLVVVRIDLPVGTWSPWARDAHAREAFEVQLYDPSGSLRARADALSAGLSLSMEDRHAVLRASCLKEDLAKVLALVRDVLASRDFDRRELKRWSQGRQIGWDASLKEPSFRRSQAAARSLFAAGDPRRFDWEKPPGVEADVARLATTRDTLLRIPGRVVAFAGDLGRDEAERAAAGVLPEGAADAPPRVAPELGPVAFAASRGADRSERIARLTQVYFGLVRDSLPWTDADYPAFLVADHVLGGHFYSRLYVALRHEGGETYGAETSTGGDVVVGPYALETFTRAANAATTEQKLREVLRVFHEKGITEQERADAVSSLEGQRLFERQSPEQILSRFLLERRLGLPAGFIDEAVDRAARLTADEINRFIGRWYDPAEFTLIRVEPAESR